MPIDTDALAVEINEKLKTIRNPVVSVDFDEEERPEPLRDLLDKLQDLRMSLRQGRLD